jgi:hypothetical protein
MRGSSDGKLVDRSEYKEPKPEFSIGEVDLPEIKNWKVGKKYSLALEVEMVSSSKGDNWDFSPVGSGDSEKKPKFRARFKILSASEDEDDNQ